MAKSTKFQKGAPRPPGAGRKKGSTNKTTAQIREMARMHAEEAIETLVEMIRDSDTDSARIAAIKELLDRGLGKATAHHELTGADGAALMPVTINMRPLPDPK